MKRLRDGKEERTATEQARAYLAGTVVYDERTLIADLLELVEKYGNELIGLKEERRSLETVVKKAGAAALYFGPDHDDSHIWKSLYEAVDALVIGKHAAWPLFGDMTCNCGMGLQRPSENHGPSCPWKVWR